MKKIILPVIVASAMMMTSCESGPTESEIEADITEMQTTLEETEVIDEEINAIEKEEEEIDALFEDL